MYIIRSKTLGEILGAISLAKNLTESLGETFHAESLGSDYMHEPGRNSLRNSFFYESLYPLWFQPFGIKIGWIETKLHLIGSDKIPQK